VRAPWWPSTRVILPLSRSRMAFAYAFGNESNSYVNPALTLGVVIAGEGKFSAAVLVFLAQLLGGAAGGVALARV
jgi:glycerol uptake facilitator-like aquaporin